MSEVIRFMVEQYYDVQKLRLAALNGIIAYAEANMKKLLSQLASETHTQGASRGRGETRKSSASRKDSETQNSRASQKTSETQSVTAPLKPRAVARLIIKGELKVPKEVEELVWYYSSLFDTEKQLAKKLDAWSSPQPIRINFLNKVQGIGPILSSGVIAWIVTSSKFATISKLWAYCGLSAEHYECECDGQSKTNKKKKKHKFLVSSQPTECPVRIGKKRVKCTAKVTWKFMKKPMRRKRGFLAFYNPRLKVLCWKIAASFEKQKAEKSRYRRHYVQIKKKYLSRPDLAEPIAKKVEGAELHVRLLAMRHTAKRFLADLWLFWRRMEGLTVTLPYARDILGHTYEPWEPDKE